MKETKTEKILKRIDKISRCSGGIFVFGIVALDQVERAILKNLISRNPSHYEMIEKVGIKVFRTTIQYTIKRKLNIINKRIDDSLKILQHLVWSSFIMESEIEKKFTTKEFIFLGNKIKLDSFTESKERNSIVITIPIRESFHVSNAVVPSLLYKKRYNNLMKHLISLKDKVGNDSNYNLQIPEELLEYESIIRENFGEGYVWPKEDGDFHEEKLEYDFQSTKKEFTGKEKYEMDIKQIKNWENASKLFKEDGIVYMLGVWPNLK